MSHDSIWARVFGPVPLEPVEFETLELRPTPNQHLVSPPGLTKASPHAAPPVFDAPVERLEHAFLQMVGRLRRVRRLASQLEKRQYNFEVLTPVLRFPDAITVRFLPQDDGRSTLAIYSRSLYGRSDFGTNKRRVEEWLERLRKELAQKPA